MKNFIIILSMLFVSACSGKVLYTDNGLSKFNVTAPQVKSETAIMNLQQVSIKAEERLVEPNDLSNNAMKGGIVKYLTDSGLNSDEAALRVNLAIHITEYSMWSEMTSAWGWAAKPKHISSERLKVRYEFTDINGLKLYENEIAISSAGDISEFFDYVVKQQYANLANLVATSGAFPEVEKIDDDVF
ncbi:MAG: hypothetical protein HOH19_01580 [Kordiimonadaceae bacterium]|nr:hypothetical protein [Kordiimonadaceae bacterium]MBT6031239.1 hypothetical protein [Kordiimonadaceae bacterium]